MARDCARKYEYEFRFRDFDYSEVVKRAVNLGANLTPSRALLINIVYNLPSDPSLYIRVRQVIYNDRRTQCVLTVKRATETFDEEYEVEINDMESCLLMLDLMNCKVSYILEKFRDTFVVPEYGELDFDTAPGLLPYLEVECHTEEKLYALVEHLGLGKPEKNMSITDLYEELYGITRDRSMTGVLTFANPENVEKYITRNGHIFRNRLRQQRHKLKRYKAH